MFVTFKLLRYEVHMKIWNYFILEYELIRLRSIYYFRFAIDNIYTSYIILYIYNIFVCLSMILMSVKRIHISILC